VINKVALSRDGYCIASVEHDVICAVRHEILHQINSLASNSFASWQCLINDYCNDPAIHSMLSSKSRRVFNPDFSKYIYNTFAPSLSQEFNSPVFVTDEENYGYPEFYWRIVRPHEPSDVGSLHKDSWFWDLNCDWQMPPKTKTRLKVWIPLQIHCGLNGLLVLPGSHMQNSLQYTSSLKDGKNKPTLISTFDQSNLLLLSPSIDQCIIFHDNLLHGGSINRAPEPRVSFEFTFAF